MTLTFANFKLGVENSWPPYADASGEGISKELVLSAYKHVGLSPEIKAYPYSRVLNLVTTGEIVGGFNVTRQESTVEKFIFGKESLFKAHASIYYGSPHEYKSLKELPSGLKMGVIRGYEYGDKFEKEKSRFNIVRVNTQEQLLQMVARKRIEGAILFDLVKDYTVNSAKMTESKFFKGFHNHTSSIFVAFSRKEPRAKFYAEKLDEGLRLIRKNGEYNKIFQRHRSLLFSELDFIEEILVVGFQRK